MASLTDKQKIMALLDSFGVMDWKSYCDSNIVKTTQVPPRRLVFDAEGQLVKVQRMRSGQWRVIGSSEGDGE